MGRVPVTVSIRSGYFGYREVPLLALQRLDGTGERLGVAAE